MKNKPGIISITILLFFIGNMIYMLSYPTKAMIGYTNFKPWLGVFFSLLTYSCFFIFALLVTPITFYSLDIFSLLFFKIWIVFKFIFYSLLINSDMPTYIKWLDSKLISVIFSIFIIIFTIAFTFIVYDRDKKLLG